MTRPGNPAPAPRSSQTFAAGARRRIWAEFLGEMPVPKLGKGLGRDEICSGLPLAQKLGVANKPVDCFTWNFKGFRKLFRTADGF